MRKLFQYLPFCLLFLCLIMLTSCSRNSKVNGTYYKYENDSLNKASYVVLKNGKWKDDDGVNGTYELKNKNISFYITEDGEKINLMDGTVDNGILKMNILGVQTIYCKNGKKPSNSDISNIPVYKVTYDLNGGELNETEKKVTYDEEYTLDVPTRIGYSFVGWYINSQTQLTNEKGESITKWNIDSDTTVKAMWKANTYTLSLKKNNENAGTISGEGKYEYGKSVVIKATTNKYYEFIGWYDSNDNLISKEKSYTFRMGLDSMYIAKYACITLTLHYIVNGQEKKQEKYTLESPITVLLDGNGLYEANENFVGWYAEEYFSTSNTKVYTTQDLEIKDKDTYVYGGTYVGTPLLKFDYSSIGYQVSLYNGNNKDIVIPSIFNGISVTDIGYHAFSRCSSLTSVVIPESVTSIGYHAFSGCSNLTSIEISNSVTSIAEGAFSGCSSLTSVVIPESVTDIGYHAFSECSSLTSVVISESVTSIGYYAFSGCSSLTSVVISESVTSIGYYAFSGCSSLTSIVVDENNKVYDSRDNCNAIIETITNKLIAGCKNTIIPNSVTSIGGYAFWSSNLTSIVIPESVTFIGDYAFSGCSSLTSITLPFVGAELDGISNTHFGYIFGASSYLVNSEYVPSSLKEVVITGGTSIASYAFSYCSSLTSVVIPESVTNIGDYAFSRCSSLTSIVVDENNKVYDSRDNCNAIIETITNKLIAGCKNTVIPNSVTSIAEGAFSGCSSLTSVVIPESVTSIGYDAFSGCSSLTSIVVDENNKVYDSRDNCNAIIETITNKLIAGCKNTVIPNSVTSIGGYAFWSSSLTSIEIPNSVTSIGDYAFYNCSNLTSIVISNSVTSIGDYSFTGCSSLTSIEIPNSVTGIGEDAFSYCSSLTSVVIPESVTSIGDYAFYNCSSLTSIVIPESVTNIGDYSFSYCIGLTSIVIPESVTNMGSSAFSYCGSLTIYCEAQSKPLDWDSYWNPSNCPVYWAEQWQYINGVPTKK
ncbi:MAG: leucine-rich repeat protein [Prevotella sp.]|nr:leucine-rich repeat protein [Prevotella sp.]